MLTRRQEIEATLPVPPVLPPKLEAELEPAPEVAKINPEDDWSSFSFGTSKVKGKKKEKKGGRGKGGSGGREGG